MKSASVNLSVADRSFFDRVSTSAFTNPFGDERGLADRCALGLDREATFDEVLDRLLAELAKRIAALAACGGRVDCTRFAAEDRGRVTIALLFLVFHASIERLDALIQQQLAAGDASCAAPFTGEICDELRGYGFTHDEAAQYVAIFYQLRRAFYFITNGLVGSSPAMKQLRKRLWENIFTHDVRWYVACLWNRMEEFSTLLLGETGTGKGAAAAALGRSGFIPYDPAGRCFAESFTRAFVPINLSQYPETLIESELFGHRKGAFTGAVERHEGVFARCSPHGAIFLDEIGDTSEPVQIKLLQVLQQRTFSPVGGHETLRFEGRVIAATNKPLGRLRRAGVFRDDFYYRLCSDQIEMPPLSRRLRELPSELETLVTHMLRRMCGEGARTLVDPVMGALAHGVGPDYAWPGNVRELEQAVRRILLTGRYTGDTAPEGEPEGDLAERLARGELTVKALTAAYCRALFKRYGRYEEVAKRTGLDWRTAKKYAES
ncbi:MAG: sigma 54-interacting transcriptional regulator [Kiritimatiellae bacterium]|nr:sigma 54-interacting transcriptional regulator [Kiritimatiellia bacterium]